MGCNWVSPGDPHFKMGTGQERKIAGERTREGKLKPGPAALGSSPSEESKGKKKRNHPNPKVPGEITTGEKKRPDDMKGPGQKVKRGFC